MNAHVDPTLLSDLLAQCPDAVIFAAADGTIQYWNAAAERVFGHTAAEAVGRSLDLIIPERFRESHWSAFERAVEAGATKYDGQALATRSQRKDGTAIYVELAFAMVQRDGATIGALATARDITERFQKERAQRERLAELERQVAAQPR